MYNPFMPKIHMKSLVTWGGGGGGDPAQAVTAAATQAEDDSVTAADASSATQEELADQAAQAEADRVSAWQASQAQSDEISQSATDMQQASIQDPTSLITTPDVATIDPNAAGTTVDAGTGQLTDPAPQVTDPTAFNAAAVNPVTAAGQVAQATSGISQVQGSVDPASLATAQTADPNAMSGAALDVDQITTAQVVNPAAQRTIESGEMISGSAVDMAAVDAALDIEAAQADPTTQATVRGQMAELMTDFEGTIPPPWAAGALRNATAQMAARGLGSSSMAGQALVQAAMESALPIAMADAQTCAKFESQNLSNRQQTAMFAAEQRASFLGMEFTQEFQTRVANASKISDVANMNFTAEQTIALENARMAQTVDITNLNAKNGKIMADAAAMSQMDLTNLNNRQQAAVQNAQAFLAMDMKNVDLEQQTEMFKAQSNIQSIFTDQAATNAAAQFNASSENQTNQFFANMATQVQQFNAGMEVQRDQFNSQNALVIAQANAQWRQNASTVNTAAQNEANRSDALAANAMTQSMVDTVWQRERDIMDYAFRQSESATDRALSVFLADKQVDLAEWQTAQSNKQADKEGAGYVIGKLLGI